jgi:hypothetical protein
MKNNLAGKELSRVKRGSGNEGISSFDHAAASVVPPTKYLSSFDSAYFPSSSSSSSSSPSVKDSNAAIPAPFPSGSMFPAPPVTSDASHNELLSDNASYHSDRVTLLNEGSDGEEDKSTHSKKTENSRYLFGRSSSRGVNDDSKLVGSSLPSNSFPSVSSDSGDGEMTIGGERKVTKRKLPQQLPPLSVSSTTDDSKKRTKHSGNFNELPVASSVKSSPGKMCPFNLVFFICVMVSDNSLNFPYIPGFSLGPPLPSVVSQTVTNNNAIPPEELQFIDLLHRNQDVSSSFLSVSAPVISCVARLLDDTDKAGFARTDTCNIARRYI